MNTWHSASTYGSVTGFLGLVLAGVAGMATMSAPVGLALAATALIVWKVVHASRRGTARSMCGRACASAAPPVNFLGWYASSKTFEFTNLRIAGRFARGNQTKLLDVTQDVVAAIRDADAPWPPGAERVRQAGAIALASHEPAFAALAAIARQQHPPSPGARRAQPDHEQWVEKLEKARGSDDRDAILASACLELDGPQRTKVQTAFARIVATETLEKVNSLQQAAAKRRHLQKAIVNVESAGISDDVHLRTLRATLESLVDAAPKRTKRTPPRGQNPKPNDDMFAGSAVGIVVLREEVEDQGLSRLGEIIAELTETQERAMSVAGAVTIAVTGYDEDNRPLWLIPEFREFVTRSSPLLSLLAKPDFGQLLARCYVPLDRQDDQNAVVEALLRVGGKIYIASKHTGLSAADTTRAYFKNLGFPLPDALMAELEAHANREAN